MARITDLPREILMMILLHFELTGQRVPNLRAADEVHIEDIAKRATLVALAQVCKSLNNSITHLLYEKRYLHLDLASSDAQATQHRLALLSMCRKLHQVISRVRADCTKSFLLCLVNSSTATYLQSLSLTFTAGDTGCIDLRSLSDLPNLQGLELGFFTTTGTTMIPSSELHSLKSLRVHRTTTFAETIGVLSMVSTKSLEFLELRSIALGNPPGNTSLWKQTFGHKCLPRLDSLMISVPRGLDFSANLFAEIPTVFPSLKSLGLAPRGFDLDYNIVLSCVLSKAIHFEIWTSRLWELKAVLLAAKASIDPKSKGAVLRVNMAVRSDIWRPEDALEIIHLSKAVQNLACLYGVGLTPISLPSSKLRPS